MAFFLAKTRSTTGIANAASFTALLDSLILADVGVETATAIIDEAKKTPGDDSPQRKLETIVARRLRVLEAGLSIGAHRPFVMTVMGVNGAGKTTLIAKLCRYFTRRQKTVLLAAGDTFRAAAKEQLQKWATRVGDIEVVVGDDPSAVAFDAVAKGIAAGKEVVIIDTAGRLPTQTNLMAQLAKTKRAAAKALPQSPHELLLVLDATVGQNALSQIQSFSAAVGVTGIAVTKLDGSAKGGFLLALAAKNPKPLRFISVGEGADDLLPFNAEDYAKSLLTEI